MLIGLEQKHNVSFTYADENITEIQISPPPEKYTLEQAIGYLEKVTGLVFEKLSSRYIVIRQESPITDICVVLLYPKDDNEPVAEATVSGDGSIVSVTNIDGVFRLTNIGQQKIFPFGR